MQKFVANFVAKFLNYQQVRVEQIRFGGTSKNIKKNPIWKWERVIMDFIISLLRIETSITLFGSLSIG